MPTGQEPHGNLTEGSVFNQGDQFSDDDGTGIARQNFFNVQEPNRVQEDGSRTLMKTPKNVEVVPLGAGEFTHYDLEKAIIDQLKAVGFFYSLTIHIHLFVDGIPILDSRNLGLGALLGKIVHPLFGQPLLTSGYYGREEAPNFHDFMSSFQIEYIGSNHENLDDYRVNSDGITTITVSEGGVIDKDQELDVKIAHEDSVAGTEIISCKKNDEEEERYYYSGDESNFGINCRRGLLENTQRIARLEETTFDLPSEQVGVAAVGKPKNSLSPALPVTGCEGPVPDIGNLSLIAYPHLANETSGGSSDGEDENRGNGDAIDNMQDLNGGEENHDDDDPEVEDEGFKNDQNLNNDGDNQEQ
ncbi:hypothetical protein QAD02_005728 [Eretmocerus hayati]|uniref:Uncharacterized protein n=1 Tax=Eretmocerus hayati TaxID=131215 RepID=A0ACC2NTI3_9HYME|nr:hypothetical protein QAD02_005728 [Eretmocerus hayati]